MVEFSTKVCEWSVSMAHEKSPGRWAASIGRLRTGAGPRKYRAFKPVAMPSDPTIPCCTGVIIPITDYLSMYIRKNLKRLQGVPYFVVGIRVHHKVW